MKKLIIPIAIAIILCIGCAALVSCGTWYIEIPENGRVFDYSEWKLDWSDEFEGSSLDHTKWKINTMPSEDDNNGVRRAGYYVDDEDIIFVNNSNLTIRTKYKDGKLGAGWYTSWVESSVEKHSELAKEGVDYQGYSSMYGYYEVRCIAPPSVGIWSAFWMMPDNSKAFSSEDEQWTGSDGVEIDVMESPNMYVKGEKNVNTHVVHGDDYNNVKSEKSPNYKVPNMYTTFHTYGVEWNETEYIFYIDGIETWRSKHTYEGRDLGVAKVNEYMILSVEVGGTRENGNMIPGYVRDKEKNELVPAWCGNPDENDKSKNYDFVIDYVRVYKKC